MSAEEWSDGQPVPHPVYGRGVIDRGGLGSRPGRVRVDRREKNGKTDVLESNLGVDAEAVVEDDVADDRGRSARASARSRSRAG
ncbi:hypothetical protein J2752_000893 [Halarchaeum rubridurum]|uniref:Uncharacterized protein n=1 Tax=Halarchaeum rubridurum TaxID=489911 RepID=A0A8T4GN43_9EURY|nr:hypothetical protein [Halarchaeum rubridurum]MBP1954012.1 hypothetical protein [Halarchaeum rubridurum]